MGLPVLIIGESGSGKSTSMRNFQPGELGIINVSRKPLPFRTSLKCVNTDNYMQIDDTITKAKAKSLVIDDAQYLMANEFMRNAKVNGYQKFTDIALNFWTLVQTVVNDLPDQKIVYFMAHTERDASGNEKMKTIGKMLDEKITIEGLFTIVMKTVVQDGRYMFSTQTNGQDTVKTPMGMFDQPLIDNDLRMVDMTIREYYGLPKNINQEENKDENA
ncbi:MAG: ATP-binding protein [Clostridiales bacterium]|nr:MAG: ATP-binding protein [Clostridiales bacterium]